MQVRNILNRIQKHKGFVYGTERWGPPNQPLSIEIPIRARRRSRGLCSVCERPGPGCDTLPQRRYEFIPLWGILIFFCTHHAAFSVRAAESTSRKCLGRRAKRLCV